MIYQCSAQIQHVVVRVHVERCRCECSSPLTYMRAAVCCRRDRKLCCAPHTQCGPLGALCSYLSAVYHPVGTAGAGSNGIERRCVNVCAFT